MAVWIYGRNAVRSRLENSSGEERLYAADSLRRDPLVQLALRRKVEVRFAGKDQLKKLCGSDKHQGFVLACREYPQWTLDDLIEEGKKKEYPLLVLLDGLEDPHNLGAVLRCVDAVGGDGVVYARNRSVSLNGTAAKVASGAAESVKTAQVTNLVRAIRKLKECGYWIVGAYDSSSRDYRTVDYKCPIALVIGGEGKGISPLAAKSCDFLAGLPMRGKVNSLNASVAAGIFLYAIDADRHPAREVSHAGKLDHG